MNTSFQLDQNIAIVEGDLYFDLHNCFDFVGFEYRPTEKTARFEWRRSLVDWVTKEAPKRLILSLNGVTNFAAHRRDDETPFTEDCCLSSITFLPPDLSDYFEAVCPNYRADDEHISILFRSGAGFKIWAESVTHEVELA